MRQGVRLEPLLQAISDFLDEHQQIVEQVRRDLVRGLTKPGKGRRGLRRNRSCARSFSSASRTGTIVNCVNASPME
jgi:ribosomal protein L15E